MVNSNPTANNQRMARALKAIEKLQAKVSELQQASTEAIAVTGLGCRFPGRANSPESFWKLLERGIDAISLVPPDRWDADTLHDPDPEAAGKIVTRFGGFVDQLYDFDAAFFGIAHKEAVSLDPQQRLLLEVSWEALEQAGVVPEQWAGRPIGVFVGISSNDYSHHLLQRPRTDIDAYLATGNSHSVAAGRLSYSLGLTGPSLAVDTACSSSLVAVHLACQSLRNRECDAALVGGVNYLISPKFSINFSKARMLAADGRCKTFDASADGFVRGEGCGVVVLKRLSDAIADEDTILALIRGSAINQDGRSSGLTVPNGPSQQAVIRQALKRAGIQPGQISYIEAHGTGTSLGDPIEVGALGAVFGTSHSPNQPLQIASVKTNIGHLEAAAGIAGFIKVVLAMQHETLPPHLHFHQPSPYISWSELPIAVTQQAQSWPNTEQSQFAGVSSFGFSGTNAHVVLESASVLQGEGRRGEKGRVGWENGDRPQEDRSYHLLTLSAKDSGALRELAQRYVDWLPGANAELGDICWSGHRLRSHFSHRLTLVVSDLPQLRQQLAAYLRGNLSPKVISHSPSRTPGKIAFLFTGQGSQYPHMGRDLYTTEPVFRQAIDHCAEILAAEGVELLQLLYLDSASDARTETHQTREVSPPLSLSSHAQPALFALEYALAQLWFSWGIEPDGVMGHSLGEYVAACIAGVFSLEAGLRLVSARGRLMQALPQGGGMVAVMAAAEHFTDSLPAGVAVSAFNGPAATVISGELTPLESVVAALAEQGIKTKPLQVSHAFHSALMEPMLAEFREIATTVDYAQPQMELISNVTGEVASAEIASADYWVNHVRQPVQFAAGMRRLAAEGYDRFIEMGPKPVLTAMGQACLPEVEALWLPSLRPEADWQTLLTSLGQLYVSGAAIDWAGFDRSHHRRMVQLPTYPFQRQRYWVDIDPSKASQYPEHSITHPPIHSPIHPLLGEQLQLACTTTIHFEGHISPDSPAYLQDHQVFGVVVLPAAGFVEMAIAALQSVRPDTALALEGVGIHQALVLDQPKKVQVLLLPMEEQLYRFEILSLAGSDWVLHASGQIVAETVGETGDFAICRSACGEPVSVEACYQWLADQGVTYSTRFWAIERIWKGNNEVLSQLRLPKGLHSTAAAYQLHPVLLDACLQSLAAVFLDQPQAGTYLPAGVAQISLRSGLDLAPDNYQLWCHAQVQPGERGVTADIQIFLADGQPIGKMQGLTLRPATADRVLNRTPFQDWLYQVDWQAQPLPDHSNPADLLSPKAICDQVAPIFESLLNQAEVVAYRQFLPQLEVLSLAYIKRAIAALGDVPPGFTTAELAQAWGIAPQQQPLFQHLLGIVTNEAKADGNGQVEEREWGRLAAGEPEAELTLLRRCGENLAAVLRGEVDPLTLLFPNGDLSDLMRLYQSSVGARVMNELVQQVVTAAIAQPRRPIRILEIGAGTGGTTAHLLPHLKDVEYVFSDVSPLFLSKAQARFPAYGFMRYELLDIERPPGEQGFEQPFDLVIAANVLHATADLRQTLTHVRELLAPAGELILLEGTQPLVWLDLIFGLTEGWWKFQDRELRPHHPLLTASQWQALLEESGFAAAIVQPNQASSSGRLGAVPAKLKEDQAEMGSANLPQAILLAQRDQFPAKPVKTDCLILAESQDGSQVLTETLETQSIRCIWTEWGDRYAQPAPNTFTLNPCTEDFRTLWQDLTAAGAVPEKVVYLSSPSEFSPKALEHRCRGLLHLVQMLANLPNSPQLYLVTQGAAHPPVVSPAQAPLWGLGRVIALEHPALRCCRLDLDPDTSPEQQVADLAAELIAKHGAETVAYRQGQRWVARLGRANLPVSLEVPDLRESHSCFRLAVTSRGTPDSLRLQSWIRHSPKPDEVEIRVDAAGLNFIDVLDTLGLLPFERDWLGVECVGEVVTVGANVEYLRTGDRVMALAMGSLAQYVTVPAMMVVPRPQGLNQTEAATIPANFLTAYYALVEVAQVQPGERVLIHAAAGGTGMAAVQIALSRGAEVFATASPHKWEVLKQMGVRQVMNSRTLDFADAIMTATLGNGVDVVFNSLSGEFIPKSLSVLKPQGRLIEIGKRDVWSAEQVAAVKPQVAYHQVDLLSLAHQAPQQVRAMLIALTRLFETRQLGPLPHRVFSITDAVSAFRTMQQAKHVGKIVLTLPFLYPSTPPPTYLITGGLGGLGLLTARWLAEQSACHLVLVSRRAIAAVSSAVQSQIQSLEVMGAKVTLIQADVSKRDELDAAITSLNAPLRGVIHAAGVLDDGVLQQLTWERMEKVMAPKVHGAWNLHQLTQDQPLDFFVLYSSAASLLGSPGQGSHVAANAFLDALAHYRQAQGLPGLSINWGAWSVVGAAAQRQVDQQMQVRGVDAIAPDQGLHILSQLLYHNSQPQIGVIPIRWPQFLSQGWTDVFFEQLQPTAPPVSPTSNWLTRLQALPERQRLGFLTAALQQEVAKVLGRPANQLPDPRLGFFDMGLDSLMAVELKNSLEAQLRKSITSTAIFEHPTIAALAKHLAETMQQSQPLEPTRSPSLGFPERPFSPSSGRGQPNGEPESKSPSESPDTPLAQELAALERLLN